MTELLPFLVVGAGAAAVTGVLLWLGGRVRRRGVGMAMMNPIDEIYHPAAHHFRFEIEQQEQRLLPMPAADDQVDGPLTDRSGYQRPAT